jgi:hypothetical protein
MKPISDDSREFMTKALIGVEVYRILRNRVRSPKCKTGHFDDDYYYVEYAIVTPRFLRKDHLEWCVLYSMHEPYNEYRFKSHEDATEGMKQLLGLYDRVNEVVENCNVKDMY